MKVCLISLHVDISYAKTELKNLQKKADIFIERFREIKKELSIKLFFWFWKKYVLIEKKNIFFTL